MRLAIAAIMALWATGAEAQSPWIGKTLSAKFEVTAIACKDDTDCKRIVHRETSVTVYISSKSNVFDYGGKGVGTVAKVGEWRNVGAGRGMVELNKDAVALFAEDASSTFMVAFFYKGKGKNCTIGTAMRLVDPSYKVHTSVRTEYCNVKIGNVPP